MEGKNAPTILVVLGATGDLMARKLSPAVQTLYLSHRSPEKFAVVGFARRPFSDAEFRQRVAGSLHGQADKDFLQLLTYHQGQFDDLAAYEGLGHKLKSIDDEWGVCTNKLFYLAVPPEHYETILNNLASSGLTKPCSEKEGWTRVLVEKPFGKDLREAIKLDKLLTLLFKEEQVYRVDHYLAKEAVQNIIAFRFANNFLENAWDKNTVEKIEVKLLEKIDIEGRGAFYDGVGALLDVGQNHLLQMLALVTMDNPVEIKAESIREKRAEIIESIKPVTDVSEDTVFAQYAGYQQEVGVAKGSNTETYFKLKAYLNHPKWQGVPLYIEAGKKMPEVDKQVILTFKHPSPCLCPPGEHYKNQLFIRIQPDPGIAIRFWSKKPGTKMELEEQWLKFHYPLGETERYQAEYAQLLLDAIAGDQTLFVSSRETMASWKFIDPIIEGWRDDKAGEPKVYSRVIPDSSRLDSKQADNEIGIIGLGKMGYNLGLRLQDNGWKVTGFDPVPGTDRRIKSVASYQDLLANLGEKKIVWLMVPHNVVDDVLFAKNGLIGLLSEGDVVIDGGNSNYKDSANRAKRLAEFGIKFMDVGVSGGPEGARTGPALMIGGEKTVFEDLEELFADLALPGGYKFFEGHGAGHFVKMVHNGIEYGMMQAIAEGFSVMKNSGYKLDLAEVAQVFDNGSVIESRLIGWLTRAFDLHGLELKDVTGRVVHTGEGKWTVEAAEELGVKAKVIKDALDFRIQSQKDPNYTGQVLMALREQFGGHSATLK